jgi:hypothetical protein
LSNVIKFPKKSIKHPISESLENAETQMVTGLASLRAYHINEALQAIIPSLFNKIELAGFELEPEDKENNFTLKDGSFIVEAIRSLLCKIQGIDHPFQNLAEKVFNINENNEVLLADKVEIELTLPDLDDTMESEDKPN